jgi:hypothetical protein
MASSLSGGSVDFHASSSSSSSILAEKVTVVVL